MTIKRQLLEVTLALRTLILMLYGNPLSKDYAEDLLDQLAKVEDELVKELKTKKP